MPRLLITDTLGDLVVDTRYDDGYSFAELGRIAGREARAYASHRGRVAWQLLDAAGHTIAGGEAEAPFRPRLLPVGTQVLYREDDLADAALAAYGTVRAVQADCYVLAVEHVDSGGRPVPIGAMADLRVPIDTPPAGARRTLEALQGAHAAAAE